ncbi:hypothetical protein TOPH_05600 [Tolypocladium ophioglossoides CBS 100239]|uniref:AA1-like domain-containing protein n=1 Tax=Tolypocladium ophioglossoides (strain CBS 100239) TaxID=1163406 RepID=A0A0L0N6F7_TOLOC|nr:hypothetical protein TOPH_05600 [Tolypocladium ophioglossoides CBS 100239]
MLANILTTLLVAGAALAAPTPAAQGTNTCTSKSTKVKEWTVGDFDFHSSYLFTTPAHQNSWGYVNFTLVNPAVDYKVQCTAASNQLQDFYYGNLDYKCDVPVPSDKATFTFARPANELLINQTWNCAGEGSRFEARGGVRLNLTCSDTFWQNPDWKQGQGQFYSTRFVDCQHVTVQVPVKEMSGVA